MEGEHTQLLFSIYCLSIFCILLFSTLRGRSECRLFDPLQLLLLLPPSTFEMCTMSGSCWSRDTSYYFPLEDARWHVFTSEVTVGDNEIGGPFHPHIVSLIAVCQLLVWLCMSAHLSWVMQSSTESGEIPLSVTTHAGNSHAKELSREEAWSRRGGCVGSKV